jgi:hypothetical protein
VRNALGTLPWVEQGTIQTDVARREVRFDLKEGGTFDEEEVRKALRGQGFPEVSVKSAPGR